VCTVLVQYEMLVCCLSGDCIHVYATVQQSMSFAADVVFDSDIVIVLFDSL